MDNYLFDARKMYLEEWEITSDYFRTQGYYDWCAKHLTENIEVLEIGVGIGNSTLSLLKRNCKIIAIEENHFCLEKAALNIQKKHPSKIDFGVVRRMEEIEFENGKYEITYSGIDDFDHTKFSLALIEGNFIADTVLRNWLATFKKFDAITCWFTGIHGAIKHHKNDIADNPPNYRIALHDEIFASAQFLLNDKGILNFCERGISLKPEDQNIFINEVSKAYKTKGRNLSLFSSDFLDVPNLNIDNGMEHAVGLNQETVQYHSLFSLSYIFNR